MYSLLYKNIQFIAERQYYNFIVLLCRNVPMGVVGGVMPPILSNCKKEGRKSAARGMAAVFFGIFLY